MAEGDIRTTPGKSELLAAYKTDNDDGTVNHLLYITWWSPIMQTGDQEVGYIEQYKTVKVTAERWEQAVREGDLM